MVLVLVKYCITPQMGCNIQVQSTDLFTTLMLEYKVPFSKVLYIQYISYCHTFCHCLFVCIYLCMRGKEV